MANGGSVHESTIFSTLNAGYPGKLRPGTATDLPRQFPNQISSDTIWAMQRLMNWLYDQVRSNARSSDATTGTPLCSHGYGWNSWLSSVLGLCGTLPCLVLKKCKSGLLTWLGPYLVVSPCMIQQYGVQLQLGLRCCSGARCPRLNLKILLRPRFFAVVALSNKLDKFVRSFSEPVQ